MRGARTPARSHSTSKTMPFHSAANLAQRLVRSVVIPATLLVASLASCTQGSTSGAPSSVGTTSSRPEQPSTSSSDQPASVQSCDWQIVPTPNRSPSALANQLTAISASGPRDAWAVGSAQQRDVEGGVSSPLLVHWDGNRWRLVDSAPTAPNAMLLSVVSISPQDAWAVGFAGSRSGGHHPLVEHWNGSSWSAVSVPAPPGVASALSGVFAISADDIWSVGNTGMGAKGRTLTEHWDGSRWVLTPSPNASPPGFRSAPDNALVAVGASSHNDVVAVGTTRDGGHVYHADPLIENWNGTSWAIVPTSLPSSGAKTFLESVAIASTSDAWAVGALSPASGTGEGPFIEHWDGSSWASVGARALPERGTLFGVAASGQEAWAVGVEGRPLRPLVAHEVNGTWASEAPVSLANSLLLGVTVAPDETVWAVGSSGSDQRTLAIRCSPR